MILTRLIQFSLGLAALAMVGLFTFALAQDATEAEERSAFVEFVERIISTPDRQIRLGTISGALSSNVSFSEITVSDREGVWLRIEDVHLVWSRLALLRGRLEISSLEAASIHMDRRPLPPEDEIPEEAQLTIPELPVAMNIAALSVPRVSFGEGVFGLASQLSVDGRLQLEGGDLDTALDIDRLDGPGGELALAAVFDSAAQELDLNLRLSEPADGVVANLLDLQGRPALSFAIVGSGPLDDFVADIQLVADGSELLAGSAEISRVAAGYRFLAELDGRLGELVPPVYSDLFGEASTLSIDTVRSDDGAISVRRADIRSGVMLLTASAELAPDQFPISFALDAQIGTESEDFVTLPFGDGVTVRRARIIADVGQTDEEGWSAQFEMQDLISGAVSAESALVTAGGIARNRADPENREVTFDLSGTAEGLTSSDAALAAALGNRIELAMQGDWAHGAAVMVETARVALDHAEATFSGQIVDERIDGSYRLTIADLEPFSGIAGLELDGAADLSATGFVGINDRSFALELDGTAGDIALGIDAFDGLFEGHTGLTGHIGRDEAGDLRFDELVLDQANVQARINGLFTEDEVDLAIEAALPDVAVMTDGRASGAARLDVFLTGVAALPAIDASLAGEDLVLIGRPFTDATARFTGTVEGRDVAGDLALTGTLDGVAIEGGARIVGLDGLYVIEDLMLSAGETALAGDLTMRADTLMEGGLRLDSPDLSVVAPLFLTEMTGAISAELDLLVMDDAQAGRLRAEVRGLRAGNFVLGSADIDVSGENLRVAPILAGNIEAAGIVVGPVEIDTLSATAERVGDQTEFSAVAELTEGTVTATGRLVPDNGGLDIEFDTFELREAAINAILAEPVVISLRDGAVAIPSARLNVGGGRVVLSGEVGEMVDLSAEITALNLAVANAFAPDLGLAGTVSGTLAATGPRDAPQGSFALRGDGLSAATLSEAGVGALAFEARGTISDGDITVNAAASGGGVSMTASGTVPVAGPGLDLVISGSLPLALSDVLLAARGASLRGTLNVEARVTGSLAAPSFAGSLAADGATFADVETGIQLSNITLRAGLTADQVVIETLTASTAGGGLSASGVVGLAAGAGFPANLTITLADFRYQDGRLITAAVNGQLTLTGPLAGQPVLGGVVNVERAEITVPEGLPAGTALLDVEHRAPPPAVAETLRLARVDERRERERAGGLILDVTINAPARVFVRGRGIDAEFGGSLTLTGLASDIQPIGSFEMRRGHIGILGQRIVFNSGRITLVGDLDPMLNVVAMTSTRNMTITASVTGRASDPDIVLSSVPELPQEEVLAQFLFGRSLNDLSPFQLAQLATAAAGLAGADDGTGLLGQLRGATGLDELDLVAGEEGGVAVQAGRYVTENVYLGVRAGGEGDARATINLDITEGVTARGEVGADGRSRVGVFFEREY
jgi:translocation and assembly module TamB